MDTEFSNAEPRIDSRIINGSYSTCAPRFRPWVLRYVRHDSEIKFLMAVAFWSLLLGLALGFTGESIKASANHFVAGLSSVLITIGGLLLLLAIKVLFGTRRLWHKKAGLFENGELTPGIVLTEFPLEVAVMAPMSNRLPVWCWGIRRLKLSSLPVHEHAAGTRIPFVSTFVPGNHDDRWVDFKPIPISYGTGSRKRIEGCAQKLGNEGFDRLAECIRQGRVPLVEDEITLVDKRLNPLSTISRGQRPGS